MIDKNDLKELLTKLRKKENVIGGSLVTHERIKDGIREEGTNVIRVYVSRKVPIDQLRSMDIVPRYVTINGKEYEIDIVDIGDVKALSSCPDPKKKYRPLKMGISTMNARSSGACSLGVFAIDLKTDEYVQLSNQHCFGLENDAKPGDLIVQPSKLDGCTALDTTGEFIRGVDLKFDTYNCRGRHILNSISKLITGKSIDATVDVSCASIYPTVDWELKTPNDIEIVGAHDPTNASDDAIWAYGRSSSYSHNTHYLDLSGYVSVGYSRGTVQFTDIVIGLQTDTFKCIPGDSGSPWFEEDKIVGLRFAGSNISWIGCKWNNICSQLCVDFP